MSSSLARALSASISVLGAGRLPIYASRFRLFSSSFSATASFQPLLEDLVTVVLDLAMSCGQHALLHVVARDAGSPPTSRTVSSAYERRKGEEERAGE
jgi:hypothetical protein